MTMTMFFYITGTILFVAMVAVLAVIFGWCDWEKVYYTRESPYPYYYRVTLPCRTWQFRNTILHGWYTHIPGLYYCTNDGHIYFYVWRDERYL